jgi:hypothetical protein
MLISYLVDVAVQDSWEWAGPENKPVQQSRLGACLVL